MYHCDECDLNVHENDRENHVNGNGHKYRIRQKNNEKKNEDGTYECSTCCSKFSNIGFYTVHMGSKTHKRNLRRINKPFYNKKVTNTVFGDATTNSAVVRPIARRVPIQGIDKYISLEDLKESCDYKSTREKYRPKNTKNQEGHNKTYMLSVCAYWAINLALDPTVEDFKIAVNDKEWGDFGDAVIQIEFKETSDHPSITTTFAVQFKHISNNVKNIDSLSEGPFNLAKYVSQISKIKGQNLTDNKKFVLFTTATVQSNVNIKQPFKLKTDLLHRGMKEKCLCSGDEQEVQVVPKTLSNARKLAVNTSGDNENIYFFFATDNVHFPPKLYFYTQQKKLRSFSKLVDEAVDDQLEDKHVGIHRDFIKYIEYWSDGFLGGNYRLKKEDVLVKLGQLLLVEYRVPPHVRVTADQNYVIWNQAVNCVDVTVLTKHPMIVPKICTPINFKIEKDLRLKIDTTTSTLKVTQNCIGDIENSVLKMYIFEETLGDIYDDIPLDIAYEIFWKAGLIPMLLRVKDIKQQDYVLAVISMLKGLGLTRRYYLITSDQNIKTSLKYYKTLTFFLSLDDVARKIPSFLLDYVKISVTDTFSISLKTIQDCDLFFQKAISAQEFFDMSVGQYSFKPISNQLAKREHGAEDAKLILDDSMMDKLKKEIESKNDTTTLLSRKSGNTKDMLRGISSDIFY